MISSWKKSVKWAKSPGQTPGTGRTNGQTPCLNGSNPPPPGESKMWCSDEIISFGTRTDRHTHTYKAKPIHPHPRYVGCSNAITDIRLCPPVLSPGKTLSIHLICHHTVPNESLWAYACLHHLCVAMCKRGITTKLQVYNVLQHIQMRIELQAT